MIAANKLCNVRRRVNRARHFPDNTCPASRHLHIIAEQLLRGNTYWLTEPADREHVAGTMLSVLESLWKARSKLTASKVKTLRNVSQASGTGLTRTNLPPRNLNE